MKKQPPWRYEIVSCNLQKILDELHIEPIEFADLMGMNHRQQASAIIRGDAIMGTAMTFSVADVLGIDPRRIYTMRKVPYPKERS
jgi:plasmid maintenance system antidote protein VapI